MPLITLMLATALLLASLTTWILKASGFYNSESNQESKTEQKELF